MRKRLRKKRRFGEFQELEIPVAFRLNPKLTEAEVEKFLHELVAHAEQRGLVFLGSGDVEWYGAVTRAGRGSPSEQDKMFVHQHLTSDPRVETVSIGPLRDAWNGQWEAEELLAS